MEITEKNIRDAATMLIEQVDSGRKCKYCCPGAILHNLLTGFDGVEDEHVTLIEMRDKFCHKLFPELAYFRIDAKSGRSCGPCPCLEANEYGKLENLDESDVINMVREFLAEQDTDSIDEVIT